jgi:hypothetical protein
MPFVITVQTGHGDNAKAKTYDTDSDNAIVACGKFKAKFAKENKLPYNAVRVMKCLQKGA